jgi:hypothetical protein
MRSTVRNNTCIKAVYILGMADHRTTSFQDMAITRNGVQDPPSDSKHSQSNSVESYSANEGTYDSVLDKRVWRKLDWLVLPTVAIFYLLSFLVRRRLSCETSSVLISSH